MLYNRHNYIIIYVCWQKTIFQKVGISAPAHIPSHLKNCQSATLNHHSISNVSAMLIYWWISECVLLASRTTVGLCSPPLQLVTTSLQSAAAARLNFKLRTLYFSLVSNVFFGLPPLFSPRSFDFSTETLWWTVFFLISTFYSSFLTAFSVRLRNFIKWLS